MLKISVKYDGLLDFVTAPKHNASSWVAHHKTWSELLTKFNMPYVKPVTRAEFDQMPETDPQFDKGLPSGSCRQGLKDVGGFCGAKLNCNPAKRKAENVVSRQLVTLDLDKATGKEWDVWRLAYGYAACIYSTIKHLSNSPRIRFILPLDRPVSPDEYGAIARRIAAWLGMDAIDPTCFRLVQFMYWPTSLADVEPVFDFTDGPWLSADYVLDTYIDWRDRTEYPKAAGEEAIFEHHGYRQQDPTEKSNIVGTFCRLYTIQEAIELFLPDIYAPCDIPGRYTYIGGTSFGGLVVYEDLYAYSHHSTDPAGGKLCNAFDLLRLHLFGQEDAGQDPSTAPTKLPSYRKMETFVYNTDRVKKSIEAKNEIWRQKVARLKTVDMRARFGLPPQPPDPASAVEDFKDVIID